MRDLKYTKCIFSVNIDSPNTKIDCKESVRSPERVHFIKVMGNVAYFPILPPSLTEIRDISIVQAGLKEISQSDLQAHKKLEALDLRGNKIQFIHQNAFDGLNNLMSLGLTGNTCINADAKNSTIDTQALIKATKEKCSKPIDPSKKKKLIVYVAVGLGCLTVALVVTIVIKKYKSKSALVTGVSNRGYESHTLKPPPRARESPSAVDQPVEGNRKKFSVNF